MEQEKALQVLVEVALVAQAKGVLSLEDAVIVKQAIDTFKAPQEAEQEDNKVKKIKATKDGDEAGQL